MRMVQDTMTQIETRITFRKRRLMSMLGGIFISSVNQVISIHSSRRPLASFRPLLISSVLFILALAMPLAIQAIQPNTVDPFMVGLLQKAKAPPLVKEVRHLVYNNVVASWYGPGFDGRRTASGETYHQQDMTVASRSLRFGT